MTIRTIIISTIAACLAAMTSFSFAQDDNGYLGSKPPAAAAGQTSDCPPQLSTPEPKLCEEKVQKVRVEIAVTNGQIADANRQIIRYSRGSDPTSSRYRSHYIARRTALVGYSAKLQKQLTDLMKLEKDTNTTVHAIDGKVDTLNSTVNGLSSNVDKLANAEADMAKNMVGLGTALKNTNDKVDNVQKDVTALKNRYARDCGDRRYIPLLGLSADTLYTAIIVVLLAAIVFVVLRKLHVI